jgi:hypothetical protein
MEEFLLLLGVLLIISEDFIQLLYKADSLNLKKSGKLKDNLKL